MSARLALLVGAALLCGGCEVKSDIGKRCTLVRSATQQELTEHPELGKTRPILESQLQPGQDFISFGAVGCEDLICVRDTGYTEKSEDGYARGYCSKACIADAPVNSCVVTASDAEANVKDRMACRALLLDQKTLDDLRAKDPDEYRRKFGENNSPYFCAGVVATSGN